MTDSHEDSDRRRGSARHDAGDGWYAYPHELAELVHRRWIDDASDAGERVGQDVESVPPPEAGALEHLLSICYHASFLREENRPVTFRLAWGDPRLYPVHGGPPGGMHRLVLDRPRPLDEQELRRITPAAEFHRSLIGVSVDDAGRFQIWGLVHSGPRWLQSVRGGRGVRQQVPSVLMVAVMGPGRLGVGKGTRTLAMLASGKLTGLDLDVFAAPWLQEVFADLHQSQWSAHLERGRSTRPSSSVAATFGPLLARHALRRIVATIRAARRGGTLIFLPPSRAQDILRDRTLLSLKYAFRDEEPRRRVLSLTVAIMNELSGLHPATASDSSIGWAEYVASNDTRLAALDESLFAVSHFVATLAEVDGAVALTNELEILGFGGEIAGDLPEPPRVQRALDLEGTRRVPELNERVGTRHRSAYRLCAAVPEALAIVVSHDGGVRFVRWHDGDVTCWDQIATGPWEI